MSTRSTIEQEKSRSFLGISFLLIAIVIFTCQDAITKHLAQNYPVPFFIMIRYWAFAAFAIWLAHKNSGSLTASIKSSAPIKQIVRALILVGEMAIFAYALAWLKIADAHAIFAAYPLITTALAVPLLGEQVGWRRWLAVSIGFLGVLIVLRPGLGVFQPAAIIPIIAAFAFAAYAILTRMVSKQDDFATTLLYTALFGAIAATLVGPFFWANPTPADWGWIAVLCLTGVTGHFLLIKSLEYAAASVLQPFNYLMIVCAAIVGFVVFGEIPDEYTIIGACVIAGSGLYVIWREQVRASLANRRARAEIARPR